MKGQWLERMSVTFMTEAMDMAFGGNLSIHGARSKPAFSVQSERDIWWLGAFEVPKETHEVLAFVFDRIPFISNVIRDQTAGHKLDVEGWEAFTLTGI